MQIPTEALPSYRDYPVSSAADAQNATLQDREGWFVDWLTQGGATSAGQSVSEASALKVATVFACVRNISEDIAKLPLIVYRKLKPRGKERAENLPLYSLLHDAPSHAMSSFDWRQVMTVDALCGGNGYSEIIRNGAGEAVELQYIPRQRIVRMFYDEIWKYEVLEPTGGVKVIEYADMFHLKGLGDGMMGWSVIRLARETIGGAMAAEEHANSTFADSAVPSGILEHPGTMKKEAREQLIKTWEARHQNKRKMAVLEGGLKYNALSVSNKDSEFLESRQFSVEEICRWFRMPPHKVMHLLRSTFSNIEEQNIEYVVDCLTSWGVRWEQEIKRKLIPKRTNNLFAELLFEGLLRGDSLKRAQLLKEKIYSGQLSPNDAREIDGMNPVEGGDEYFMPSTMTTLDLIANPPEPPAPQPPLQAPQEPSEPTDTADAANNRRQALIAVHCDVLADAVGRMLKIEAAHVEKHAGQPNGGAAIEKFYRIHAPVINAALPAPIEAFGVSYWLSFAGVMPDEAKLLVVDHGNTAPVRHVAMSRGEMAAADSIDRWNNGTRAAEFARAELERLADRLDAMLARYRPDYLRGDAA